MLLALESCQRPYTVNIHTHFLPMIFWALTLVPYSPFALPSVAQMDGIELIFTGFTLLCMFNSSLWHTMSGCADPHSVEMSARIDYVGIGWSVLSSSSSINHGRNSDLLSQADEHHGRHYRLLRLQRAPCGAVVLAEHAYARLPCKHCLPVHGLVQ